MSDIKLKSCPHCGREDCCASAVDHGNIKQERWWGNIFCRGCNMNGPDIGPEDTYEAWFEKAVEVWNALPRPLWWTGETPTENGWYIYQERRNRRLCCVIDGKVTGFAFGLRKVEDLHGEWAGPIPEPEEKK